MDIISIIKSWLERHLLPEKGLFYIGGSDTLPPPLDKADEEKAIIAMENGDECAKKLLTEHNLRLVVYISRRFENTGVNLEDLISIGTIGLIKAINTFRSDKNIKLATYASRCIENEILMHLRKISNQRSEVSFDEPLNTDWDGKELLLSDVLGTEGDVVMRPIEADVDRKLLSDAVARLSPGKGHHLPALRPGGAEGADPEGGGRPHGHLPVVYLPAGKAHHLPPAAGHPENELR